MYFLINSHSSFVKIKYYPNLIILRCPFFHTLRSGCIYHMVHGVLQLLSERQQSWHQLSLPACEQTWLLLQCHESGSIKAWLGRKSWMLYWRHLLRNKHHQCSWWHWGQYYVKKWDHWWLWVTKWSRGASICEIWGIH